MNLQFFNGPANIGICKLGMVVQKVALSNDGATQDPIEMFGHIVGFGRNSLSELLVKVRWESNEGVYPYTHDDTTTLVHPTSLFILV